MTEIIESGSITREKLLKGIDKLAEAVSVTLGPKGRNVLIKNTFGKTVITKDGVTVAKEVLLKDHVEALGAGLVKDVSIRANDLAGDGTTTATVIAAALYKAGLELLDNGLNPLEIKKGIEAAAHTILKKIKSEIKEIKVDSPELRDVIMISSNGSGEIANTITNIYKKLGPDAVIAVEQGDVVETMVKTVKGMQFDKGYLSPYSITNQKTRKVEFENPLIFMFNGIIKNPMHIIPVLIYGQETARPVVILADDVKEEAFRTVIINFQNKICQSSIVQAPGFSNKRLEYLEEIATLTGGKVMDENTMMTEIEAPEYLGESEKMEITSSDSVIVGGKGGKDAIKQLIEDLREKIANKNTEEYSRKKYEESLSKITGGVALIKVGANSSTEASELKDRFDDAKFAAKAALQEGIVQGGGMALFRSSLVYKDAKSVNESFDAGAKALCQAVTVPAFTILSNAGKNPLDILGKLEEPKGYDANEEVYVETMLKAGIVDPFKVIRIALESAVSIVGTLLTTEYTIVNLPDNKLEF